MRCPGCLSLRQRFRRAPALSAHRFCERRRADDRSVPGILSERSRCALGDLLMQSFPYNAFACGSTYRRIRISYGRSARSISKITKKLAKLYTPFTFLFGLAFFYRDDLEIVARQFQYERFVDLAVYSLVGIAQFESQRKCHTHPVITLGFDGNLTGDPEVPLGPFFVVAL